MNLNIHFHSLFFDGAYVRDPETQALRFCQVPAPTTEEIEKLVATIAVRVERYLARQGFGPDDEIYSDDDDAEQILMSASVAGRFALGKRAKMKVRRYQVLGGQRVALPPRCAACEGYNLHAGVALGARNRKAIERLCRYMLRPPLAKSRLEERADGAIVLHFKKPWSDGTTAMVFSPEELIEKLAALVPPPRANQILYHGVLAARSQWRAEIVPKNPKPTKSLDLLRHDAHKVSPWIGWADLLWRIFGAEGWDCPHCHSKMELRAVVVGPPATLKILKGLAASARGPPQQDLGLVG